jgi:hypothetical protein
MVLIIITLIWTHPLQGYNMSALSGNLEGLLITNLIVEKV